MNATPGEQAACLDDEELMLLSAAWLDRDALETALGHALQCRTCGQALCDLLAGEHAVGDVNEASEVVRVRRGQTERVVEVVRVGDTIDQRYEVVSLLGLGGMGKVVRAHQAGLGRDVAIKILRGDLLHDEVLVRRFSREARSAAQLKSEHAVQIHDVGRLRSGAPYFAMEYLDGTDLADLVEKQGPLDPKDAILYIAQACEALEEAHRLGIVHRDIKPQNLVACRNSRGEPSIKVVDFGIAKTQAERGTKLTATSAVMGSPLYMSPEQIQSTRDVDHRSDIWSLGATLYFLTSATTPFYAATAPLLAARILYESPRPLRGIRPELPEALERVILQCLQRDPALRPPSAAALGAELRALDARRPQRSNWDLEIPSTVAQPSGAPTIRDDSVPGSLGASQPPVLGETPRTARLPGPVGATLPSGALPSPADSIAARTPAASAGSMPGELSATASRVALVSGASRPASTSGWPIFAAVATTLVLIASVTVWQTGKRWRERGIAAPPATPTTEGAVALSDAGAPSPLAPPTGTMLPADPGTPQAAPPAIAATSSSSKPVLRRPPPRPPKPPSTASAPPGSAYDDP